MGEKVGRNDPCLADREKNIKIVVSKKSKSKRHPLGDRKFTAKVLSAGGPAKPEPQERRAGQSPLSIIRL